MKTLFFRLFLPLLTGIVFASCAPPIAQTESSTTLVSAPSNDTLSRTTDSVRVALGLSCGCSFPAATNQPLIASYGDTSIIHFQFAEPLAKDTNVHTIIATFDPSHVSGPGSSSSWIALNYLDNNYDSFRTIYDTIRVTANY